MFSTVAAVFSLISIVGGGLIVLFGLAFFVGTIRFLRIAETTAGVVVGHEAKASETPDHDGFRTAYVYPIVAFDDATGKRHRVTLFAFGTAGYQPFPVGKQVVIQYPPNDIARARIHGFLHLWSFPVMFIAGGVSSILFGLWFRTWTSHLG